MFLFYPLIFISFSFICSWNFSFFQQTCLACFHDRQVIIAIFPTNNYYYMLRLTSCEFRMCSNNRKLHFVSHFTYKRIRNPLTQTGFHLHCPVKRVEGGFCWTVGLEINAEPRTLQEIGQPQSAAKWTVPVLSLSLSLRVCPYLLREISRPHKTMWKTFVAQINHVPSFSLKISFQCLYPSLYFSLSLFKYLCLSPCLSLLVVWFFGSIFMLFRLPVERLLLLCFPRRISKSFPFANAQAQSCAQNCVLCAQRSFRFSFGLCLRKVQ